MCLQVYRHIGYLSWSSQKWQIPIPTTLFKEQGGRVTRGDSFILSHSACIIIMVLANMQFEASRADNSISTTTPVQWRVQWGALGA